MMSAMTTRKTDLREIALGTTHVTLNDPEFLRGLEMGLEYYFDGDGHERAHSMRDISDMMVETMLEESQEEPGKRASDAFRAGFLFGWLMGLLHPAVPDADERLSWVEALAAQSVCSRYLLPDVSRSERRG
jgi:hypothetical protein